MNHVVDEPVHRFHEAPEDRRVVEDRRLIIDDDEPEKPTHRWLWSAIAFLGGAVIGLYWFGYRNLDVLTKHSPVLAASVQSVGGHIDGRVQALEQKVRDWDQQNFAGRLTGLEQSLDSRLKANTQQVKSVADRLRADVRTQNQQLAQQVARLQSEQEADRAKLASVQDGLSRVEKDTSLQRARIDADEYNRKADREAMLATVDDVKRGVNGNQQDLKQLANNLQPDRIDFEAGKGHSYKITDGVQLNISGINVAKRQVSGWVWTMPDRKTVWIRDLNALQPLAIYSDGNHKRQELVITRVTKDTAIGYLLVPKPGDPNSSAVPSAAAGDAGSQE